MPRVEPASGPAEDSARLVKTKSAGSGASGGSSGAGAAKGGGARKCRLPFYITVPGAACLAAVLVVPCVRVAYSDSGGREVGAGQLASLRAMSGVVWALREVLFAGVAAYVWRDVRPVLATRRAMALLWVLIATLNAVTHMALGLIRDAGDDTGDTSYSSAGGSAAFITAVCVKFFANFLLPLLVARELKRRGWEELGAEPKPAARTWFTTFAIGAIIAFAYGSAIMGRLVDDAANDTLDTVSLLVIPLWALALLADSSRSAEKRTMGDMVYASIFLMMLDSLSKACSSLVSSSINSNPAVISMLLFNLGFSFFRVLFFNTLHRLFGTSEATTHMFLIQFFQDAFTELTFLGVRFDAEFAALMIIQLLRQVLRDTHILDDWAQAMYRAIRRQPRPTPQQRLERFESRWRATEQNLLSEVMSSILVPWLLALDLLFSGVGRPSVTNGMSTADVYLQLAVFVAFIVLEAGVHVVIRAIMKRRLLHMRKLARAEGLHWVPDRAVRASNRVVGLAEVEAAEMEVDGASPPARAVELRLSSYREVVSTYFAAHTGYFLLVAIYSALDVTTALQNIQDARLAARLPPS